MSGEARGRIRALRAAHGSNGDAPLPLSEHESLGVLAAAGLEVVRFELGRRPADLPGLAAHLGYPLVLKGLVPNVAHKTERGLVHPWIRSEPELLRAAAELPAECDGFLLEEQVRGIRELVLGVVRDPSFGATVLVAMGGVHSELLDDTSFVVAPVREDAARAALGKLRCACMFGAYRGEAAAREELLVAMMCRLGELALDCPEVRELDINPVILRRDGTPVAASALVVL
jgi:hypothetical protein